MKSFRGEGIGDLLDDLLRLIRIIFGIITALVTITVIFTLTPGMLVVYGLHVIGLLPALSHLSIWTLNVVASMSIFMVMYAVTERPTPQRSRRMVGNDEFTIADVVGPYLMLCGAVVVTCLVLFFELGVQFPKHAVEYHFTSNPIASAQTMMKTAQPVIKVLNQIP